MNQKQKRIHFLKEIRVNAVKFIIDGGRKCGEVAAEQQILVASAYNRVRQARLEVEVSLGEGGTVASLKKDHLRLRKELERPGPCPFFAQNSGILRERKAMKDGAIDR